MTDRLDPSRYLGPGEALLWQGRPAETDRPPMAIRIIRAAGWATLACFAFFALMAWANRAEMAGSWGIMGAFLALSGLLSLAFLVGYPRLWRASQRCTRFAVTSSHAVILRGVWRTELLRYPVAPDARILVQGGRVQFGQWTELVDGPSGAKSRRTRTIGFGGLAPREAEAAATALRGIKGKASGPMTLTPNPEATA